MKLKNFERSIDEIIVGRGRNYYRDGRVERLEAAGEDLYAAKVAGSDDYSVSVRLDDQGSIVLAECDCPYTDGPYCKHMVAVFFALRDERADGADAKVSGDAKRARKRSAAKRDWREQLREDLSRQSQERLSQLLLSLADEYPEISDRLRAEFASGSGEKEKWVRLMRRYIEKAVDDDGFISYHNCRYAVDGAYKVVERARKAAAEKQYELAVDLLLCVMREMVDMLQSADDSAGDVGMVMDEVNDLLGTVAEDIPAGPMAEACFQKLLREAGATHYGDWSQRLDLLNICAELAATDQQRKRLEHYLDTLLAKGQGDRGEQLSFSRQYEAETITLLRHRLISKFDGQRKAADFLHERRCFPRFRELAIREAIAAGEYAKAEELALEGETRDEALPGLVRQWKERRFEVYRLWGQLGKLRAVGRELALQGEFAYYQKLKASYDSNEWMKIYPEIVEALANQPEYLDTAYTAALIEEQEWAKLFEYVQKTPYRITDFYRHLLPGYREQVYALFARIILDSASRANKRSDYQKVRSHLRLLVKIGGGKIAAELVERLLRDNPRKPAFREELQSVKVK